MCFITKEGIPHTWDIPSLFKSMLIILITNNECSLFRKGISICKLASNEWTVTDFSYFNFIVIFNKIDVWYTHFRLNMQEKHSSYDEKILKWSLNSFLKQITKSKQTIWKRTFLIDTRFKESNFYLDLTVKMYRHMFVLKMTLCNLFLFSFFILMKCLNLKRTFKSHKKSNIQTY